MRYKLDQILNRLSIDEPAGLPPRGVAVWPDHPDRGRNTMGRRIADVIQPRSKP